MLRALTLFAFTCGCSALLASARFPAVAPHVNAQMLFGGRSSAVEEDFKRRQEKLAQRQALAKTQPKGAVEVTFPQKGNKVVAAKQGEPIGAVCKRAGMRIKFDCKNGRCGTCQVRLNGRAAAKVCQGATIPGGATRKLKITLDNP
uniref:2Fe-2S ferredoxin-type domain-containing protein n=1 Tax=Calcidiscus leptoporus TaxID=127549 RepID=A0A6U5JE48_9EUKA|mmetsp:Transcript_41377/g.96745  ORF Transcript_41377/g.96745 Transcript_41377/m.96745 type:complete len:146 (+) Transcript_41377:32-469(+)